MNQIEKNTSVLDNHGSEFNANGLVRTGSRNLISTSVQSKNINLGNGEASFELIRSGKDSVSIQMYLNGISHTAPQSMSIKDWKQVETQLLAIQGNASISSHIKGELIIGTLQAVFRMNNSQGEDWASCRAAVPLNKLAIEKPGLFAKVVRDLSEDKITLGGMKRKQSLQMLLDESGSALVGLDPSKGTLRRTLVGSMTQAALMDVMNGSEYEISVNGELQSLRQDTKGNNRLPGKFAGAFDSWTEKAYQHLFGSGQVIYVDPSNSRAMYREMREGKFSLQGCSIKIPGNTFHEVLIESVKVDLGANGAREPRIVFIDSQYHESCTNSNAGPFALYSTAQPEGGNRWSISLDEALGLGSFSGKEPVLHYLVTKSDFREESLTLTNGDKGYQIYLNYLNSHQVVYPGSTSFSLCASLLDLEDRLKRKADPFDGSKPQVHNSKDADKSLKVLV